MRNIVTCSFPGETQDYNGGVSGVQKHWHSYREELCVWQRFFMFKQQHYTLKDPFLIELLCFFLIFFLLDSSYRSGCPYINRRWEVKVVSPDTNFKVHYLVVSCSISHRHTHTHLGLNITGAWGKNTPKIQDMVQKISL